MLRYLKNNLSKIVIFLVVAIVFIRNIDVEYWKNENQIIIWDVISYYAYLPATFIYHDLTLDFLKNSQLDPEVKFWPRTSPTGKPVIMTSMGLSYLYMPFFLMSHWYARIFGYNANGYSSPYRFGLIVSCLFFLMLGLIYVRKLLKFFFDEFTISIVLIILALGTNIWYYSTLEPAMPHTYGFALIAIFVYLTYRWHKKPTYSLSLMLGLSAGLISLIRPTNIVVVMIFLFWNIQYFKDVKERFILFFQHPSKISLIIFAAFIVWLPQLLYWKMQTGQYLYYSYGEENKFFWSNPHILKVLFSYRKGWFVYTPVMLLSIIGLFFIWKDYRKMFLPVFLYLIAHIYIISSWWCWWWGGSFGMRAMIDTYGILAVPLALTVNKALKGRFFIKIPVVLVISFFIFLNFFNSRQYKIAHIHWDSMTKEAYWAVFLKHKLPDNYIDLLEEPDYEKARMGIQAAKKVKPE